MTAAVILFGAGCLWSIAGALCRLIWTASLWRKLLALAAFLAHKPRSGDPSQGQKCQKTPLHSRLSCDKI